MVNYSYNDLKTEFEYFRENWMPAKLPPFQAPSSNNTSNADSKIYTSGKYRGAVNFFSDEGALNPFCKRVNCYNVNLGHTHSHPETKQEYAKKVVRLLKKWQNKARDENSLDQTELSQLSKLIKLWEEKNPFKDQEKALLEHRDQTVFSNPVNSKICLEITDKLKKEIEDGKITDDTDQPDPNDFNLCGACRLKKVVSKPWEKNYFRELENNCRAGTHLQSLSEVKNKVHNKCWKIVEVNEFHDVYPPCGCSNVKSSDLLESSPINLVKSFFILNKVKSIKREPQFAISPFIRVNYLDGRSQFGDSSRQISNYDDLKTYLMTLPASQEVVRKDLGIRERDNPNDNLNLEEVRKKILSYFRERGIESIRLKNSKLVIKYNFKEEEKEEEPNSTELQEIQSYCQAKGVNFLTLRDLEKSNTNQGPGNYKFLLYGGVIFVVVLVIGLIAYLAYYWSRKNSQNRTSY